MDERNIVNTSCRHAWAAKAYVCMHPEATGHSGLVFACCMHQASVIQIAQSSAERRARHACLHSFRSVLEQTALRGSCPGGSSYPCKALLVCFRSQLKQSTALRFACPWVPTRNSRSCSSAPTHTNPKQQAASATSSCA